MNWALPLLALLAGCSAAAGPSGQGQHPTIVSLNPCSDAILAEVADPAQLLAISSYSHSPASSSMDLAAARRFRSVGDAAEEAFALHPDVIVASTYLAPSTRAAFARMGLRVEQLGVASSVAESRAQVRQLAALAGHPERGEALIARIDAALRAASPADGREVGAVVWQSGGIVAGQGTLITELMAHAGFANLAARRGLRQADQLPLELLLADPPRVILTAGSAAAQEDRMLRHPALAALHQTRRERLNPKLLWCGGPTIVPALARLAEVRRSL
ncbi:ABC transporter substrate-binding protein [Novosphingobium aquiterrae]|uniref:ABC transporter substrate-binding protein n=1 Tax=Novosphingobium aquiterrae TaxID=624388 RepID=A0ABV6PEC3_9SPHN